MNNQNILKYRGTKLEGILDRSEFYDFELADGIFGKIDAVIDNSEFYDYKLGDVIIDYIYVQTIPHVKTDNYIITQDDYLIISENDYLIEYLNG